MWNHKIRTKKQLLYLALCSSQLLAGCSLLPVEEARPTLVVQATKDVDYNVETVKREDLVNSKLIYCTYVQLKDESLSFHLEGKKVKNVYVETGSAVKKGDLIAELDLGNAVEDIKNLEYQIHTNEIQIKYTKTLKNLGLEKEEELHKQGIITKEAYNESVENIEKKYKSSINQYEDTLYIDKLRMNTYDELRETSKIYAGIDGMVSFVKDNLEGSYATLEEKVIRIIDNSHCAFRVETEYAPYFIDGDIVQIEMGLSGEDVYEAVVSHDAQNEEIVYFELLEPNFNLSVGVRGTINLILEQKDDVLTISNRALRKAEGFNYVYYINEDGIRSMKEVAVGMKGNNSVEITSGLEFGDVVITR